MTEWRDIPGWPRHQISDEGQVRTTIRRVGGPQPGIITQEISRFGYPTVRTYHMGAHKRHLVHRLVCAAFHGPAPSSHHEVAHADGVRTNARADNLRWATRKENCDDSKRHGTSLRGERQNGAKLTEPAVLKIREMAGAGFDQAEIAKRFGISQQGVSHVVRRTTWKHIP